MKELDIFARIGTNEFKSWLEHEKGEAVKYLSEAIDHMQINRAQGKVQLINRMLNLIELSKNMR